MFDRGASGTGRYFPKVTRMLLGRAILYDTVPGPSTGGGGRALVPILLFLEEHRVGLPGIFNIGDPDQSRLLEGRAGPPLRRSTHRERLAPGGCRSADASIGGPFQERPVP